MIGGTRSADNRPYQEQADDEPGGRHLAPDDPLRVAARKAALDAMKADYLRYLAENES